ncbi:MAG: hypothetical protein AAF744_03840 [Pseudomonadota bacterium]
MSEDVYEQKFLCAPGLRLQAHERITQIHHENMLHRLERIELMMERLERRLWFTVYGVVAVILAQAVESFVVVTP